MDEITRNAISYEVTIQFLFISRHFPPVAPDSLLPRLYTLGLGSGAHGRWWSDPAPRTLHSFFASISVPLSLLRELRPPSRASLQAPTAYPTSLRRCSRCVRPGLHLPANLRRRLPNPPRRPVLRPLFPSSRARRCLPTPHRRPALRPLFPFGTGFNKAVACRGCGLAIAGTPTAGGKICWKPVPTVPLLQGLISRIGGKRTTIHVWPAYQ